MKQSNNILRAAVAMCFGAVAGQAFALVDLSLATPGVPVKAAKEIPSSTTLFDVPAASYLTSIKLKVPAGYAISAANPLYVKLDLNNGAKFAGGTGVISCRTDGGTTTGGTITIGGNGAAAIVYSIAAANTTSISAGAGNTCSADFSGVTISGLSDVTLSATVEYKNGLNNIVSGLSTPYISFVRGMTATIASAAGSVIVDATSGSDNFDATNSNSGASLALLGSVIWTQSLSSAATGLGGNNVSGTDVIGTGSGSVTVTGPALAAALAANGTSGVYLNSGATTNCTTKSYKVSSTATNSVTFAGIVAADLSAGLAVCLNVSGGTTVITTGAMTASIGGTVASATITADFSATSSSLEPLSSNGKTKNGYFINSSLSTSKTSVLRLVNTGGTASTFTANAYNEAGTAIGTANASLGSVAVAQMLSFTSAQLETALGLTGASAPCATCKYRIVISAGLTDFKVLNYSKDVASGSINLSQNQDD